MTLPLHQRPGHACQAARSKGYTPQWKTRDGDKVIFPAPNTLFDSYEDAVTWKAANALGMIPFGLLPDGVFEFDHYNGQMQVPHISHRFGILGDGCVIGGPSLEKSMEMEQ